VIGQRDDRFSERVVDPQAFDGRLVGWHHLKRAPKHTLAHRDGVFFGDCTPVINIGRLDLANADDVGSKLPSLLLEMAGRLFRRSEVMTFRRYRPLQSQALLVADLCQVDIDLGRPDRASSDRCVTTPPIETLAVNQKKQNAVVAIGLLPDHRVSHPQSLVKRRRLFAFISSCSL